MSGHTLARSLHSTLPHLPVLYMSGYSDGSRLIRPDRPEGDLHFLAKPFTPEELLAKVRQALG
jgi:FixJ family two-component response regulator